MARVIVFDVNETLLDLEVLRAPFERVFKDPSALQRWFALLLHSSMVSTLADAYADFGRLGEAALESLASRHGFTLSSDDRDEILGMFRSLPPHPDVTDGLDRLKSAGLRLATLTNSSRPMLSAQMKSSGLEPFFEMLISVDEVRRFKPAPETYHMAAQKLGVSPGQIRMVAAHDWDVFGALRAGCLGAFIARPGSAYSPLYETPDVMGPDLRLVAERILELDLSRP